MREIALTQAPAHVRHGSNIGQPLTRRDGILKVTGSARYAADNHPPGMLYAVLAVSSIARGRVAFLDVAAAKAHARVVEVMTPANKPALAQDPDEKSESLYVPARSLAKRPGPIRQSANRRRHRDNVRGRDRRRDTTVAALRLRNATGWIGCERDFRAIGRRPRHIRRRFIAAM